jgi:hypothetical protein
MRIISRLALISSLLLVYGCATTRQTDINISNEFWDNKEQKIGVYVSKIPEVKGHITGAGCLLCAAVASGINSKLNEHMKTQSADGLSDIQNNLVSSLQTKGLNVVAIDTPINLRNLKASQLKGVNVAKKNFKPLGEKLGVEQLLVVNLNLLGTLRRFANYVPVGAPEAVFNALMYIVNTKTNTYEFYDSIRISKFADGEWKEPPNYPGLTNAYYTALELGKDEIYDLESQPPIVPVVPTSAE